MAIVASRVITAARDRNPLFTDRQKHPDLPALRFLSDYHRDLLGKVAAANPSLVADSLTIPFPLADFEAGYDLPDTLTLLTGGTITDSRASAPVPLSIVETENKLNPRLPFSAWRFGGTLRFAGLEEQWEYVTEVELEYVPAATELTALSSVLLIPDEGYLACVSAVAAFLGGRAGVDLSGMAAASEQSYLETVRRSRRARRIRTYRRP